MNFGITAGFLLATLAIGILKKGKAPDIVNYYVSGRSKSVFTITGSLVATAIGGSATIGLAGMAYSKGLPSIWWLLSGSAGLVVLGILWAERIREYKVYTLPEVLEKQYGSSSIKIVASFVIVTAWLGVIAAQMIAAGKIMNIIWPGHYRLFVTICALIFIIYTVAGGQDSVIRTDLFQAFLIFSGISITAISAFVKFGNPASLNLPAGHLDFPFNNSLGSYQILIFFLFVGTSFLAGPDMFSRILSAKDGKTAKRSVFCAAAIIALFSLLIVSIGLFARSSIQGIDSESAFQYLIINTTPHAFQGIVFAALLAAFLSSADTCLLTSGVILTNDLIKPVLFKDNVSEEKQLFISKIVIIICGIVSLLIALYVNGVLKSLFLALTVYTSGIILPVVMGFYREKLKVNRVGAMTGIVAGGSAAVIMKYMLLDRYLVWIFPAVFVLIIVASRFEKK